MAERCQGVIEGASENSDASTEAQKEGDVRRSWTWEARPGFMLPMQHLYGTAVGAILMVGGLLTYLVFWGIGPTTIPAWALILTSVIMALGSIIYWLFLRDARRWLEFQDLNAVRH